ncbi:PREDICTED: homeobox protein GHOX-7 [Bactrocera latifrons]|uniref:homeobox protein GHOX-7 n=1 Tax=Bactrocera latifrons TaxID=174628 RepID=UPI0008DD00D3|nr:PREDICTED: homeobox protein GHOX-7 [Bactrocera latifrons]
MSDFSIDYILHRAGERYIGTNASIGIVERIKLEEQHRRQREAYETYQAGVAVELANMAAGVVDATMSAFNNESVAQMPMFDWLQYTRYHPPRLPRTLRQPIAKRTPGRLPRIPFTPAQLEALESAYRTANYLSAEEANQLAESLELTNTRVKIWFQNRRARERREKRERDESYESTISSNASSPEPQSDIVL